VATERAGLIQAILQAPDDDAPRLVCADWFEEQGGEADIARAEFIRSQVTRARLAPEDPRQSEMYARELRLLKRYGPEWCGSHFLFRKARFRRGFIEYVHLHLRHFQHHRRQLFALEPVRDVSLTGFWRAPPESARRLADCAEWRHVQTLRIYPQGPRRRPRGTAVTLLESPHLTGLRRLCFPQAAFSADERRRFERLALHGRLTDLQIPGLGASHHNPGSWFSDGGVPLAGGGGQLRTLRLNWLSERLASAPFWNRLTTIDVHGVHPQDLAFLRDRLPPALRGLRLRSVRLRWSNAAGVEAFFERLAEVPLESLRLQNVPITPAALARQLQPSGRRALRDLALHLFELVPAHAEVLARSAGSRHLRSLALSDHGGASCKAIVETLFTSEHLEGLVTLEVSCERMGHAGERAGKVPDLSSASCWRSLRSLRFGTGLSWQLLQAILTSPTVGRLNDLALTPSLRRDAKIPRKLAGAIARLPHLASFCLRSHSRKLLAETVSTMSETLAWPRVTGRFEWDSTDDRAVLNRPPVDDIGGWGRDEF
jgi:uncharacterized protein (TIGR02996 family)